MFTYYVRTPNGTLTVRAEGFNLTESALTFTKNAGTQVVMIFNNREGWSSMEVGPKR